MIDQYKMDKEEWQHQLTFLYLERKPWLFHMSDGDGARFRIRIRLHWELRKGLLPRAHYVERHAYHMLLLLQRSKPKHIIKFTPMVEHANMLRMRKPWKRCNSHTGPLFWRNFW